MNNLTLVNHSGAWVADSREVAEMIGKTHNNLLRDIDGYVETLVNSENSKLSFQNFFIQGKYSVPGNTKTYKMYHLTRKGCDMVANKMTGEKGVLFTATYVTKFEEMERTIKAISPELTKTDISLKIAESVFRELRLPDSGKLTVYSKICKAQGVDPKILPAYADETITKSLSQLLDEHQVGIKARSANLILVESGILEVKWRQSKTGEKHFYSLTDAGLKYGKNLICPGNPRETQPHYYQATFPELAEIIGGCK